MDSSHGCLTSGLCVFGYVIWVSSIFSSVNWVSSPDQEGLGRIKMGLRYGMWVGMDCGSPVIALRKEILASLLLMQELISYKIKCKGVVRPPLPSHNPEIVSVQFPNCIPVTIPCSLPQGSWQCALDYVPSLPFPSTDWLFSDRNSSSQFSRVERQRQTWEHSWTDEIRILMTSSLALPLYPVWPGAMSWFPPTLSHTHVLTHAAPLARNTPPWLLGLVL